MAVTMLTVVAGIGRNIINDSAETSARKSQARFQIIQVSSSAEPRMRME